MLLNKQTAKKFGVLLLKIFISGISVYFVLKKIDLEKIAVTFRNINFLLLTISLLFMNLSQFTSTFRLKVLLTYIDISINFWQNLRLYYMGMFYNLFLPGGIGGDGIKAFILKKRYGISVKKIVSSLIIDRLSGLTGLVFLGCIGFLVSSHTFSAKWLIWFSIPLMILVYPAFYLFLRILFKSFHRAFLPLSVLGMAVNLVQTVSVVFLFLAIGTKSDLTGYLTVFYFATAAMVFPFTIGGIGIREVVFTLAPQFLPIDAETGLSFCLIFFVMNALSSFTGIFFKTDITEQTGQ